MRVLACVVAVSVLAACGGADADTSGSSDSVPETEAPDTTTTDDTAAETTVDETTADETVDASAALLVLTDFPAGWTEEPAAEESPADEARDQRFTECAGGTGTSLFDLGGPLANSGRFVSPADDNVVQTVTVVDESSAVDFIERFAAPDVAACIEEVATELLPDTLPPDATLGELSVTAVDNLSSTADDLIAYRIVLPLTLDETQVTLYTDLIAARVGGGLTGFTVTTSLAPLVATDAEHLVDLTVERLAAIS